MRAKIYVFIQRQHFSVDKNQLVFLAPPASGLSKFVPFLTYIPTDLAVYFMKNKYTPYEALKWIQGEVQGFSAQNKLI